MLGIFRHIGHVTKKGSCPNYRRGLRKSNIDSLKETLPGINIIGCHFHRPRGKVQEIGLHVPFGESLYIYSPQYFAVPFLPITNLPAGFEAIRPMS